MSQTTDSVAPAGRLKAIIPQWARGYNKVDLRGDLGAGLAVGAMLVPQAMAYALLAGLPPEVGLYASIVPVLIYALLGTSRQLAVGPVAIVSLLTAATLAPLVTEGTGQYLAAAAVLALLAGAAHLVMGVGRLGYLVNFLSHSVLVGFTAAAALIIGISQAKNLLGISFDRQDHFYDTVVEIGANAGEANLWTIVLTVVSLVILVGIKRWTPKVPGPFVVVVVTILLTWGLDLESRGVAVVGSVPDSLPGFSIPSVDAGLVGSLIPAALVITLVGFMESIAVAKVYARRNRYEVHANRELVALGAANVGAGLTGGFPVTGGFSRTAVNSAAGARTPMASVVTAGIVLATVAFLTGLFESLPNAALGAIILVAVIGLIDVPEIRHIARVKPTDLIGLVVAFIATLALGIEWGIFVAVVASMLVVFARISKPHTAELGRISGTTSYRNLKRFPEAQTVDGIRVVRIDDAVSFVNASVLKSTLLEGSEVDSASPPLQALVLDASGINDLDATGADMLDDLLTELNDRGVEFHLADVIGPVRDVMIRSGLWIRLSGRVHLCAQDAVDAIRAGRPAPSDQRSSGIHEVAVHDVVDTERSADN